ncbi:hypothetical protein ACFQXB_14010 [Plastorhodobacter daqingensis]|uniref:YMGG-like Gly-zipper domain-containing protein n=1 Tax=Plastorhodobacter daqingensis TaxID=1387281 RepID=A0ABW2UP35_9RHOB
MHKKTIALGFALLMGIAACGNTVGEQALVGGGVGAVAGAATGGDIAAGAVIGAGGNVAFCQLNPHLCRR